MSGASGERRDCWDEFATEGELLRGYETKLGLEEVGATKITTPGALAMKDATSGDLRRLRHSLRTSQPPNSKIVTCAAQVTSL